MSAPEIERRRRPEAARCDDREPEAARPSDLRALVAAAQAQIGNRAAARFLSRGQPSTSGTDDYNVRLAQRRADAVRTEPTSRGFRSITTRVKDDIEGEAGATGDARTIGGWTIRSSRCSRSTSCSRRC